MNRWMGTWIFLLLLQIGCNTAPPDYSGNAKISVKDWLSVFPEITLPVVLHDTGLIRRADTNHIGYKALTQFYPDSLLQPVLGKMKKGSYFRAIGKINKKQEQYLLLIAFQPPKHARLFVLVTSPENQLLDVKDFLDTQNDDGYQHYLHINREPTFMLVREKTGSDLQSIYTKTGWIYPSEGKFMVIMNDSNEDAKNAAVINPIDTFPAMHPFSWDYGDDKKNFISVRDGSSPGKLLFFLHIEKNGGSCTGELKGYMQLTGKRTAEFRQSGDPCVVLFEFNTNSISFKETGSCGNHRGIKCLLEEEFPKRKKPVKKLPKPNQKTNNKMNR
ncbi:MAG: hypothetical protein IM577_10005 [Chitinophagaceae bacterium]|nr:hypothetical protein [Chitinophagaceae bacterium]